MKVIKSILNIILGASLTWGAYYGYIHLGYQGLENVMVVFGWIISIMGTLCLFFGGGKLEFKPSPVWLTTADRLIDLAYAVVLCYHGYLWLSVFFVIHIIGIAKHKDYARKNKE